MEAQPTRVMGRRGMLLREGSIAARQRSRKVTKRKDLKEISINILQDTSSIVKLGTTGTMKKTIRMVKSSGSKVLKTFGPRKHEEDRGNENRRGDGLNKFFYDWQNEDVEEVEGSASREDGYARSEDTGGRMVRDEGGSDVGMRRDTWTNLSDVLMGTHKEDTNVAGEGIGEEEYTKENSRLETIQEITEISPCGRRYSTISPSQAIFNTQDPNPPALSHAASISSLHTWASSIPSPAKLYPASPMTPTPNPLRQLSASTQHLFDISANHYTHNSDPIKPVSAPAPIQDGEIMRDDSGSVYSDIFPTVKRSVSVLDNPHPNLTRDRKFSTSTVWATAPLTFDTASSREVSSSTTWIPTAPLPNPHSTFPEVIRYVSIVPTETPTPATESWKWTPSEEEGEMMGKSVKERVRELDLVIDQAIGFNNDDGQGKKGKRGVLGLWR